MKEKNQFKGVCTTTVENIPTCTAPADNTKEIIKECVNKRLITKEEHDAILVLHNNGFRFSIEFRPIFSDIEDKVLGTAWNLSLNKSRNHY